MHDDFRVTSELYRLRSPRPAQRSELREALDAATGTGLPAAQRTLCRAQRRHGWAATFDATAAATAICIDLRFWATHHPLWMRWEQRLDLLMPASYQRSMFMAVIFPEVAALAAVVAMSGWQAVAVSGTPADVNRFLHAANNALGCADPPHRHDISDAVTTCIHNRARMPALQPVSTYPDTSHHDDGTPRVTDGQRIAERLTAARFDRDRDAPRIPSPGAPMPYAWRHPPADCRHRVTGERVTRPERA